MATIIPITLAGENLGKRHAYLNNLVDEAYRRGEDIEIIKNLPENSPIDRLFKIDLASKIKNVDYIIQNLKEDDMLYVSRSLKSKWLMEINYEKIINPQYLEDTLYPEMTTTAITKMKHWLHLNLKEETRCYQFYQYYNNKNIELAIKFLLNCSNDVLINEFPKVMHRLTPLHFKIMTEKCSQIAKIFFDAIPNDENLKNLYLNQESGYFLSLRHLLRTDADMILDIYEKYFNKDAPYKFSSLQTKYIMTHHKNRFMQKPELYTAWMLNLQAVADSLNSEEARNLILKLARAKYLSYLNWFSYKKIEPLIKRLKPEERAQFKKKVFVDRDIGVEEEEWPYETPAPPVKNIEQATIFDDYQRDPYEYDHMVNSPFKKRILKKKSGKWCDYGIIECSSNEKVKTLLDKLFDEYRFVSFGKTLYDLRKRIAAESSPQNREFMMLVLVSKSGGRPDAIASLLELLVRHANEPSNVRAAIIRSLVKRAQVWRLPEVSWNQLLEFGQGLGLNGNSSETDCYEGLHAVVIRSLLLNGDFQVSIQNAFLNKFSTLTDYSLNAKEKKCIGEALSKMLLSMAKQKENIVDAVECIDKLIRTLDTYKIKVETYPGLIDTISDLAEKDISEISYLISNLFERKVARKQLFQYTFDLVKTNASYVNALKHNTSIIDESKFVEYYMDKIITNADQFLTKLSIYFSEDGGLAGKFLNKFKVNELNKVFGRPLAFLLKGQLQSFLQELDAKQDDKAKHFAATIRANSHMTRPPLNICSYGWENIGAKAIANRVLKCRATEIDANIEELLKRKRTARLALTLSKRSSYETEVFVKLSKIRPTIAIKTGFKLMKDNDETASLIWDTVKPILQTIDLQKPDRRYILAMISNIDKVSLKLRPEYSTVIYTIFKNISFYKAMPPLCHIEILLPNIEEQFIENLLLHFLKEDFILEKINSNKDIICARLYIRILVKLLLLCKNEETQIRRIKNLFELFLTRMNEIRKAPKNKRMYEKFMNAILVSFKYNKAFLNNQYVSPLPVMEKTVLWMQSFARIDKYFDTYANFHQSMLYYKAVRQTLDSLPEVFDNKNRRNNEGVEIVGNLFGKYIAREVNTLTEKYFASIPELYRKSFLNYLAKSNYYYTSSYWISSVIKGILEGSKGPEYRLGIYLIKEKYYDMKDEHILELKKYANEMTGEAQWFACTI